MLRLLLRIIAGMQMMVRANFLDRFEIPLQLLRLPVHCQWIQMQRDIAVFGIGIVVSIEKLTRLLRMDVWQLAFCMQMFGETFIVRMRITVVEILRMNKSMSGLGLLLAVPICQRD